MNISSRSILLAFFLLLLAGRLSALDRTAYFVQLFNSVLNEPFAAVSGDFNEDGHVDMAVGNTAANNSYITILLGNGHGSFPLATHFPVTGSRVKDIVVDDFNDDDHLDICSVDMLSAKVSLLIGNGQGHFVETGVFDTQVFPEYITSGDFDENGYPDITISHWVTGQMSIMLNDCQGGFLPAEVYNMYGGGTKEIDIGDFNEDDHLDLAIATMAYNFVIILYGDGSGSFGQEDSIYVDYDAYVARVGDFTNDEHDDIAVGTKHSFLLFKGDGAGSFERTYETRIYDPHAICAQDFNEDGNLDAVVSMTQIDCFEIYLGNGNGSFVNRVINRPLTSSPRSLNAADFNEDGHLDLVSANEGSDDVCLMINQVGLLELRAKKTRTLYMKGDHATFTYYVSNPQDTVVTGDLWFTLESGKKKILLDPGLLGGHDNPWQISVPPGYEGEYTVRFSIPDTLEPELYQFYVNSGYSTMSIEDLEPSQTGNGWRLPVLLDTVVWSTGSFPVRVIEGSTTGTIERVQVLD